MKRAFNLMALTTGLFLAGLFAPAPVMAGAPLRVLILSGQNNHDWRETTPKLKSILTPSDRFAVEVTEHPEQCDAQTFSRYDTLLSNWNTFGNPRGMNWPETTRAALLDFVRSGKGLVVVQAGGCSFYDWPEYQQLVGASWKMGRTSHGSPHEFTVKPLDDHPITRGMKPFKTTDELWVRPGVGSLSRALAIGDEQPVAFALEFGRGRGVTLLLGHSVAFMDTPGFQSLLLRGTEWAATGKVTLAWETTGNQASADAVLRALATYRFGGGRQPVLDLERLVASVSLDTAAKRGLAGKLAALLSSDATIEAKQAACRQLSLIGSGAEAPLLARLLGDKDLSYFARLALQRIPAPEAEAALLRALGTSTGEVRVGIINSLSVRRSTEAVPELSKLAPDNDAATAGASLDALGRICGGQAASALLAAEGKIPTPLKPRWSLALLGCTEGIVASAQKQQASAILEKLVSAEQSPFIRMAAFAARVKALGEKGSEMLIAALSGDDEVLQEAAIRALRSTGGPQALAAVRAELKAEDAEVPVAAVRALANWPDATPLDDLAALASTTADARAKALALRGVAHLATLAKNRPRETVEIITRAMKNGGAPGEQKALLAALGEIPNAAALKAVETSLNDPVLADEAKAAVAEIQERLAKAAALPWDDQIVTLFNSPENLCRGDTATNLDNLTPDGQGLGPFAALDGNPETYWDKTDNQPLYWLRVDLKQPATVACLRILGYQHHNYAPRDFEVLGDGKLIKKVEKAVYQRNLLTVDLPPTKCRTIELKITGYYGQSSAIRQLGLFGKPGTSN